MRIRCLTLWCVLSLIVSLGCEFDSSNSGSGGGSVGPGPGTTGAGAGPGTGGPAITAPILLDMVFQGDGICPGDEVTLIGLNFSSDLAENVVTFAAGVTRIRGLPLRVVFPTDDEASNGLESRLTVIVPSGVVSGNVELNVGGIPAGARGFTACPQIMAVTIGRNRDVEAMPFLGPLGFDAQRSFLELHGINFGEIQRVRLFDSQGNEANIPTNTIQRGVNQGGNPFDPDAPPPTGYSVIGFNLKDDRNDVPLSFPNSRDNMQVQIVGPGGSSNIVEVPIFDESTGQTVDTNPDNLGLVINGVKVPTGVRSGPVRIRYSVYDGQVNAAWRLNFEWKLLEDPADAWRIARPLEEDVLHDGVEGILGGTIRHPSGHRLFPGGGTVRTFTWDAQHDIVLCLLAEDQPIEDTRRDFAIQFRIRPEIDIADATRNIRLDHTWETPTIVYYYMEDLNGAELAASDLDKVVTEGFQDDVLEDAETTARWGPPSNIGALIGSLPQTLPATFGEGQEDIFLANQPLDPALIQWWSIDTTRMTISFNILDDQGTPADPNDDIQQIEPLDHFNPGRDDFEFHFRSLTIDPDVIVLVFGENPLVIRLSGTGNDDDIVFQCDGILDCDGVDGESTPRSLSANASHIGGRGGIGGPGGGPGGQGGTLVLANSSFNARVLEIILAGAGGNDGGSGGETTAAVEFTPDAVSQFWGAPGGGGGHRRPGGDGDTQFPKPVEYQPARAGLGGPARGEPAQLEQTAGSGGGGGGASIGRVGVNGIPTGLVTGGAGGGGGGGAVRIVASGSVRVGGTGLVSAAGGDGGISGGDRLEIPGGGQSPPVTAGGPGGGGSGGSIVIRATGFVDAGCESLNVDGGAGGIAGRVQNGVIRRSDVNLIAGSGSGSPGWIRVETLNGGSPSCAAFYAATTSTDCIAADDSVLPVASVEGFPPSGTILVSGEVATTSNSGACRDTGTGEFATEEMFYVAVDPVATTLTVQRGLNGTTARPFIGGASITFKGAIVPQDTAVLAGGGVVPSPDDVTPGAGRDGELHVRFIPSTDPDTGLPLEDPDTGETISLWVFDTDVGALTDPNGDVVLEVRTAQTNPGFMDLTRLVIDQNATLRAQGTRPLIISVAGDAEISGAIDVSGFAGGALRFSTADPTRPQPGLGGGGGPGGGTGGAGGHIVYRNGDASDKDPANTIPVSGEAGALPAGVPEEWDMTPVPYGNGGGENQAVVFPATTRAIPGASVRGQNCLPCEETAGGGAGGGNNGRGADGGAAAAFPSQLAPVDAALHGSGGGVFGSQLMRYEGGLFLFGAPGGSGGGATPHTSSFYNNGIAAPGSVLFGGRGVSVPRAKEAPGTGGGGGGGCLYILAQDFFLRPGGRILARGGDAFQSIDLGGNGGGGGGGNVLIRVANSLTLSPSASVDVSGGRANLAVPIDPGQQLPLYEGNLHGANNDPAQFGFYGGVGGNGAIGRVRIEADRASLAISSGLNPYLSTGPFLLDTFGSVGVSKAIELGVGPGNAVFATNISLSASSVRYHDFGQPLGTDSVVVWEGADESLDRHGLAGPFMQRIDDPRQLEFNQFTRFRVNLISSSSAQESQSVRQIQLRYSYAPRPDTDCLFR